MVAEHLPSIIAYYRVTMYGKYLALWLLYISSITTHNVIYGTRVADRLSHNQPRPGIFIRCFRNRNLPECAEDKLSISTLFGDAFAKCASFGHYHYKHDLTQSQSNAARNEIRIRGCDHVDKGDVEYLRKIISNIISPYPEQFLRKSPEAQLAHLLARAEALIHDPCSTDFGSNGTLNVYFTNKFRELLKQRICDLKASPRRSVSSVCDELLNWCTGLDGVKVSGRRPGQFLGVVNATSHQFVPRATHVSDRQFCKIEHDFEACLNETRGCRERQLISNLFKDMQEAIKRNRSKCFDEYLDFFQKLKPDPKWQEHGVFEELYRALFTIGDSIWTKLELQARELRDNPCKFGTVHPLNWSLHYYYDPKYWGDRVPLPCFTSYGYDEQCINQENRQYICGCEVEDAPNTLSLPVVWPNISIMNRLNGVSPRIWNWPWLKLLITRYYPSMVYVMQKLDMLDMHTQTNMTAKLRCVPDESQLNIRYTAQHGLTVLLALMFLFVLIWIVDQQQHFFGGDIEVPWVKSPRRKLMELLDDCVKYGNEALPCMFQKIKEELDALRHLNMNSVLREAALENIAIIVKEALDSTCSLSSVMRETLLFYVRDSPIQDTSCTPIFKMVAYLFDARQDREIVGTILSHESISRLIMPRSRTWCRLHTYLYYLILVVSWFTVLTPAITVSMTLQPKSIIGDELLFAANWGTFFFLIYIAAMTYLRISNRTITIVFLLSLINLVLYPVRYTVAAHRDINYWFSNDIPYDKSFPVALYYIAVFSAIVINLLSITFASMLLTIMFDISPKLLQSIYRISSLALVWSASIGYAYAVMVALHHENKIINFMPSPLFSLARHIVPDTFKGSPKIRIDQGWYPFLNQLFQAFKLWLLPMSVLSWIRAKGAVIVSDTNLQIMKSSLRGWTATADYIEMTKDSQLNHVTQTIRLFYQVLLNSADILRVRSQSGETVFQQMVRSKLIEERFNQFNIDGFLDEQLTDINLHTPTCRIPETNIQGGFESSMIQPVGGENCCHTACKWWQSNFTLLSMRKHENCPKDELFRAPYLYSIRNYAVLKLFYRTMFNDRRDDADRRTIPLCIQCMEMKKQSETSRCPLIAAYRRYGICRWIFDSANSVWCARIPASLHAVLGFPRRENVHVSPKLDCKAVTKTCCGIEALCGQYARGTSGQLSDSLRYAVTWKHHSMKIMNNLERLEPYQRQARREEWKTNLRTWFEKIIPEAAGRRERKDQITLIVDIAGELVDVRDILQDEATELWGHIVNLWNAHSDVKIGHEYSANVPETGELRRALKTETDDHSR